MKIELKGANVGIKLALKRTLLFPILVHRVDKTVHTYIRTHYTAHWWHVQYIGCLILETGAAWRLSIFRICRLSGRVFNRGRSISAKRNYVANKRDLSTGCVSRVVSQDQSANKRRTMRRDAWTTVVLRLITNPFRTRPLLWLGPTRLSTVLYFSFLAGFTSQYVAIIRRFIKAYADVNERGNCKPRLVSLCRLSRPEFLQLKRFKIDKSWSPRLATVSHRVLPFGQGIVQIRTVETFFDVSLTCRYFICDLVAV